MVKKAYFNETDLIQVFLFIFWIYELCYYLWNGQNKELDTLDYVAFGASGVFVAMYTCMLSGFTFVTSRALSDEIRPQLELLKQKLDRVPDHLLIELPTTENQSNLGATAHVVPEPSGELSNIARLV